MELYIVYINNIGKDVDGLNIYQILLSTHPDDCFAEGWAEKPACNIPREFMMLTDTLYEYIKELKTDINFDLIQDNCCFSYQDCRDNCVALAIENIDEYEEYPEKGRIVIHYGDEIKKVEELLSDRGLITRFV